MSVDVFNRVPLAGIGLRSNGLRHPKEGLNKICIVNVWRFYCGPACPLYGLSRIPPSRPRYNPLKMGR